MKLTKKELLNLPYRDWNKEDTLYDEVYIIPSGTKHDSGFMHLVVVGTWIKNGKKKYEIAGKGDVINYIFPTVKMDTFEFALVRHDCFYPSGINRYFGSGKFKVSGLSSIDLNFIADN